MMETLHYEGNNVKDVIMDNPQPNPKSTTISSNIMDAVQRLYVSGLFIYLFIFYK